MDQIERMHLSNVSRMLNHLLGSGEGPNRHSAQTRGKRQALAAAKALRANFIQRDKQLPFLPSCNPGWKILIELYIAQGEATPISVTDIGHASAIPTATTLRWLALLTDNDLILRHPDGNDRRRTWLKLTAKGESAVEEVMIDLTGRLPAHVDAAAWA